MTSSPTPTYAGSNTACKRRSWFSTSSCRRTQDRRRAAGIEMGHVPSGSVAVPAEKLPNWCKLACSVHSLIIASCWTCNSAASFKWSPPLAPLLWTGGVDGFQLAFKA